VNAYNPRMKTLTALAFVCTALLSGCKQQALTQDAYGEKWAGVMAEFERTTNALPEPEIDPAWTVEQRRAAVVNALHAAAGEIDRVGKLQDALRPPATLRRLHDLSSAYFKEEADLFRQYAAAVEKNESTDPVRERFREHQTNTLAKIRTEAELAKIELW
jgi:hypothetical protein